MRESERASSWRTECTERRRGALRRFGATCANHPAIAGLIMAVAAGAATAEDGFWVKDAITGCAIWSAEAETPGDGASWSGACKDGKAAGAGVLVWWDAEGLKGRYVGAMKAGRVDGDGRVMVRDESGGGFDAYTGRFAAGAPVGEGYLVTAEGDRLVGELLDGAGHVRGLLLTAEGGVIRGEFKDGKGVGSMMAAHRTESGERYMGQAENGERHGYGMFTAVNDDFYVGHFDQGELDGPGVLHEAGGAVFLGFYREGRANGFGSAIDADGNVVQGRFVDGEPVGIVLVTTTDGLQTTLELQGGNAQ
jgi:hypothetical protein